MFGECLLRTKLFILSFYIFRPKVHKLPSLDLPKSWSAEKQMSNWLQDLRYSVRQLRKSPGFTVAAILTLAMAIGANAVVFSVLHGLILKPLSLPEPQSLYLLERATDKDTSQSYPDYLDLRDRNHSFDGLAAFGLGQVAINTGQGTSVEWNVEASCNYFDVLKIQPLLGRFFHDSDDHGPNSAPYIVLSYDYWHSRFHDDRGVVGRVALLNAHPFTIIGVAPPKFRGTIVFISPKFWVPMVNHAQIDGVTDMNDRGTRWIFMVVGHLRPGVTVAQAAADLNSISSNLLKTYPQGERPGGFALGRPNLLGDQFAPGFQAFIAGLMLLAGLILLAACANLGSLFAARAADRGKEIAMRLALGSSRNRILRALFTEAVMISLAGGAVGMWASVEFLRWFSQWQPFGNFPLHTPVNPDATVYALALLLSLLTGFLFGSSCPAGAPHRCIPGHQDRFERLSWEEDYCPRCIVGSSDRPLRRVDHIVLGSCTWANQCPARGFRI